MDDDAALSAARQVESGEALWTIWQFSRTGVGPAVAGGERSKAQELLGQEEILVGLIRVNRGEGFSPLVAAFAWVSGSVPVSMQLTVIEPLQLGPRAPVSVKARFMVDRNSVCSSIRRFAHFFVDLRHAAGDSSLRGGSPLSEDFLLDQFRRAHADTALDGISPAPAARAHRAPSNAPRPESGAAELRRTSKGESMGGSEPNSARSSVERGPTPPPSTEGVATGDVAGGMSSLSAQSSVRRLQFASLGNPAGSIRTSKSSALTIGDSSGRERQRIRAPNLDLSDQGLADAIARLHSDEDSTAWLVLGYAPLALEGDEEGDDMEGVSDASARGGRLVVLGEGSDPSAAMAAPATAGSAVSVLAGLRRAGWGPAYVYFRFVEKLVFHLHGEGEVGMAESSLPHLRSRTSRATFVLVTHCPREPPEGGSEADAWREYSNASHGLLRARLTLLAHKKAISVFLAHHVHISSGSMGWAPGGPREWPFSHPLRMVEQSSRWGSDGLSAVPAGDVREAVAQLARPDRLALSVDLTSPSAGSTRQLLVRVPWAFTVGQLRLLLQGSSSTLGRLILYRQRGFAETESTSELLASRSFHSVMSGALESLVQVFDDDEALLCRLLAEGETVFALMPDTPVPSKALPRLPPLVDLPAVVAAPTARAEAPAIQVPAVIREPGPTGPGTVDVRSLLSLSRATHAWRVRAAMRLQQSASRRRSDVLAQVLATVPRVHAHDDSEVGAAAGKATSASLLDVTGVAPSAPSSVGGRSSPAATEEDTSSAGGNSELERLRRSSRMGARGRPRPHSVGRGGGSAPPRGRSMSAGGMRDLKAQLRRKAEDLSKRRQSRAQAESRTKGVGRVVSRAFVAGELSDGRRRSNAEWASARDGGALPDDVREELELRMAFREIPLSELEFGRVLGRGVTAVVRHARWVLGTPTTRTMAVKETGEGVDVEERSAAEVAVKEFTASQPGARPATQVKAFMRELAALREVPPSENIVQVLGACTHPQLRLVYEYMPFGDLFEALKASRPGHFATGLAWSPAEGDVGTDDEVEESAAAVGEDGLSLLVRLRLGLDLARGLAHLHKHGRVHRDLKSHNVLLDVSGGRLRAKIGDFGTARLVAEWQSTSSWTQTGTLGYVAPEVLGGVEGVGELGPAVDVFSMGAVLWELVARDPVEGNVLKSLLPIPYCGALERGKRPPFPAGVPPRYRAIVMRCWQFHPSARPTAEEVATELQEVVSEAEALVGVTGSS
jgi:serine/threonine protein kinase